MGGHWGRAGVVGWVLRGRGLFGVEQEEKGGYS